MPNVLKKPTLRTISLERNEIKGHAIGWLIFIGARYVLLPIEEAGLGAYIVLSIAFLVWPVILFYTTSLVIVPTFWPEHKYVQLVAALMVLYPIHITCYFLRYRFIDWLDNEGEIVQEVLSTERFLRRYTWWFLYFVFVAIVFSLYKLIIEELRKKNDIERKLIETQSKFLRTQLNPQFLLGVLYAMHKKALNTSRDLSEAIRLLTEIMHYSLRTENPAEMVPISDEIKHVKNFIDLNRLRFSDQMFIDFRIHGEIAGRKILPLVLISFVENAFKHGELNDPTCPLHIGVTAATDYTHILVANKKKMNGRTLVSHGIGQQNTLLRLRIAYEDKYELDIDDQKAFYHCDLKLYTSCDQ